MQRSCADGSFPYKRKWWTNSGRGGGPLVNSVLWGLRAQIYNYQPRTWYFICTTHNLYICQRKTQLCNCDQLIEAGGGSVGLFRKENMFMRMRYSRMVRAFDCQCEYCLKFGIQSQHLRRSEIWGAIDEAVLNTQYSPINLAQPGSKYWKKHIPMCATGVTGYPVHTKVSLS